MKWKEVLKNLFKVVVGVSITVFLISKIDLEQLQQALAEGNPLYLVLGCVSLLAATLVLRPLKLWVLFKPLQLPPSFAINANLISFFFNQLLPGSIGGDVVVAGMLKKNSTQSWASIVGILSIDRFTGLFSMALAGLLYLVFYSALLVDKVKLSYNIQTRHMLIAGAVVLGIVLLLILFRKRVTPFFKKVLLFIYESYQKLREYSVAEYSVIILLSFLFHFLRLLSFYFLIIYAGDAIGMQHLVFVLFITAVITMVPLSIGALGIKEGTLAYSLGLFGVSFSKSMSVAIINRAIMLLIALAGGIVYLKYRSDLKKKQLAPDTLSDSGPE